MTANVRRTIRRRQRNDSTPATLNVAAPFDEYFLRLQARLDSIGINSDAIPWLPWESLFWRPGSIPGVSSTIQVLPVLLKDSKSVRAVVLKQFEPDVKYTLTQM